MDLTHMLTSTQMHILCSNPATVFTKNRTLERLQNSTSKGK